MKISLRRRIREGERIPFGWAVAYLDWSSFVAYAYPVGLHVIVKVARRLYWMVIAFRPGKAEQQIRDARRSAYAEGVQEGRRQIRAIVEQRVQPRLQEVLDAIAKKSEEARRDRQPEDNQPV